MALDPKTHLPTLFRGAKWQKDEGYFFCTTSKFPNVIDYLTEIQHHYAVEIQNNKDGTLTAQFPMSMFRSEDTQDLKTFIETELNHVPGTPYHY